MALTYVTRLRLQHPTYACDRQGGRPGTHPHQEHCSPASRASNRLSTLAAYNYRGPRAHQVSQSGGAPHAGSDRVRKILGGTASLVCSFSRLSGSCVPGRFLRCCPPWTWAPRRHPGASPYSSSSAEVTTSSSAFQEFDHWRGTSRNRTRDLRAACLGW